MQPDGQEMAQSDPWLDTQTDHALHAVVPWVMPPQSLALYARWWQLETWLRELIYVELRARYGISWIDAIAVASNRQIQDAAYTHMAGADNENPLAYLDYGQLLEVIEQHWNEQFSYALLELMSWKGRQNELKRIRHRIGHMRRPHPDDLGRLEQMLRDLERGTFIALASYNERHVPSPKKHHDPVTEGWIKEQHPTARRLIHHAELQYETTLLVRASRRPWTQWPEDLSRAPGVLWHVDFLMRRRTVDVRQLWNDSALNTVRPLIVHMLATDPWHVGFAFSAVDDPQAVSDAIGKLFDTVLMVSRSVSVRNEDEYWAQWHRRSRDIDYRVLIGSGWNIVDDSTIPITNFKAGGGVESAPSW